MRIDQRRIFSSCFAALLFTLAALAQSSPQSETVQVELLKSVKTKSAKVGDEVKARTVTPLIVNHGQVIPTGSIVVGRILAVQPDAPGTDSSFVTLAFDSVNLQHGQTLPLKFSLLAAMKPGESAQEQQAQQQAANSPPAGPAQPEMQVLHGAPQTPHNEPETLKNTAKPAANPGVAAQTGSVIGMPNVTLEIAEGSSSSSTFRSPRKNLQLEGGLQLILKVVH